MSLQSTPDSKRFEASRATLLLDAFMTHFIKLGGALVIIAVFGIFVFILSQILPMFRGADVVEDKTIPIPPGEFHLLGVDEWGQRPFLLRDDGTFVFLDANGSEAPLEILPENLAGVNISSVFYRHETGALAIGTESGKFFLGTLSFRNQTTDGVQKVTPKLDWLPIESELETETPITAIASGETKDSKLVVTVQSSANGGEVPRINASLFGRKKTLVGAGQWSLIEAHDLTPFLTSSPKKVLVPSSADAIVLLQENNEVEYFFLTPKGLELRQKFHPFADYPEEKVSAMGFLFGDVSLVFTSSSGRMRVFSLFQPKGENNRVFGQTKEFVPLNLEDKIEPLFLSSSPRNKSFLIASGRRVSLRHSTSESVRWEALLNHSTKLGVIGAKYDRILICDTEDKLHYFHLEDHHPEISFKALFGKVWYEGAPEPRFDWQSTGGTDDFEPKLSLVPLIMGTLKGTLYAMIFAVPIALLAAIYTSQFLRPEIRAIVKPVMEIMASLPSVVLGFLAALWLAPILEQRVPSLIMAIILLCLAAYLFGIFWSYLPYHLRRRVPPGLEFLAVLPIVFLAAGIGWQLGPTIESLLFTVKDEGTGTMISDFRRWWPAVTGTVFEQRNSLVVGFMMGFAVIPIIFTITEDALSNVPAALKSGSLALGASRWQTALNIVLPTASPGVFSAIMIGLGRAVGETMIVVMATGNTPIMEWNIFSGMRTLSANIAVELPEAPVGGTLYRTLFLGAMVLFLMTFLVNTVAEVLRQWLREKYKTV